ncbi:hypothetical protein VUR80DRAFT_8817 [Thermomyces stellatus]
MSWEDVCGGRRGSHLRFFLPFLFVNYDDGMRHEFTVFRRGGMFMFPSESFERVFVCLSRLGLTGPSLLCSLPDGSSTPRRSNAVTIAMPITPHTICILTGQENHVYMIFATTGPEQVTSFPRDAGGSCDKSTPPHPTYAARSHASPRFRAI